MSDKLTFVQIDSSALLHNISSIRTFLSPHTSLACVLKSNAYGHGLMQVMDVVKDMTDVIAVASAFEALQVRSYGYQGRILVLSFVEPALREDVVASDVECVVYTEEDLHALSTVAAEMNTVARVHLKIDTGASRVGILPEQVRQFIQKIDVSTSVQLVGVFSHFADSEDPSCAFTNTQLDRFASSLHLSGNGEVERHMACSAAIFLSERARMDVVRLGLSLYGMWPSEEVRRVVQKQRPDVTLQPVMRWITSIVQVKDLPKGVSIGYGCSYTTRRDTVLAVLPVGYWDGYDRHLSNVGEVLVSGERCPVLGRVCMNLTMIDVTDLAVRPVAGDEVVLLGAQGERSILASELAGHIGTINYEVTTRVNPLLSRVLI